MKEYNENLIRKAYNGAWKIKEALLPGFSFQKYWFIKKILSSILKKSSPAFIRDTFGHNIYLDPMDSLNLSLYGVHEPSEISLFEKLLRVGDVVVDVGANIGYFSLIFAQLIGTEGKVYAFEPSPVNYSLLKKNITANQYSNIVPVHSALSDGTCKTLRLYLCETNCGDHRVFDSHDNRAFVEIAATSLDDYFCRGEHVDFIKIDVQGAEMQVLQGMRNLLQRNPDIRVLLEYWPRGLSLAGTEPKDLITYFESLGFEKYELIDGTAGELRQVDYNTLTKHYTIGNDKFTNILASRNAAGLLR
jgi:FkbM family methyltransferase